MPKQFAVQTRTIILNMLVRDRINDEFICIYNSIEKHITELVSRDCQVLSFILLSLYYHVEVYEDWGGVRIIKLGQTGVVYCPTHVQLFGVTLPSSSTQS